MGRPPLPPERGRWRGLRSTLGDAAGGQADVIHRLRRAHGEIPSRLRNWARPARRSKPSSPGPASFRAARAPGCGHTFVALRRGAHRFARVTSKLSQAPARAKSENATPAEAMETAFALGDTLAGLGARMSAAMLQPRQGRTSPQAGHDRGWKLSDARDPLDRAVHCRTAVNKHRTVRFEPEFARLPPRSPRGRCGPCCRLAASPSPV